MKIQLYRLRPIERELKRVADALETLLLLQYNYRSTPLTKAERGGPEPGVTYSDEHAKAIAELRHWFTKDPSLDPANLEDLADEGDTE